MAFPTNRLDFIEFCLRKLGKPVIEINMSPEQIEDTYEEALLYFQENHMDASERIFYKYEVDQNFIDTKYINLPPSILSVSQILDIPGFGMTDIVFDYSYQIASDVLWNAFKEGSSGVYDYVALKQSLREIQFNIFGPTMFDFNKNSGRLRVDIGNYRLAIGNFLLMECYQKIDPEQDIGAFKDPWFINYTTACLKKRWASNMSKFQGVSLPGGVTLNGSELYMQAEQELQVLEQQLLDRYSSPLGFFVG